MQKPVYLKLHPRDNVLVLARAVEAGESIEIDDRNILMRVSLPLGHKIAARPINSGEQIVKYGVAIGTATVPIGLGEHVHLHNMRSNYMQACGSWTSSSHAP